MLYSMTAYACESFESADFQLTCEIKTVNSRYLDLRFNLPTELLASEIAFRQLVQQQLNRGKVDIKFSLSLGSTLSSSNLIQAKAITEINKLEQIQALLATQLQDYKSDRHSYLSILANNKELFENNNFSGTDGLSLQSELQNKLQKSSLSLLSLCLDKCKKMRLKEGEHLGKDMLKRLFSLATLLPDLKAKNAAAPKLYLDILKSRISTLLEHKLTADEEARLYVELALLADKHDVTEELTRLNSHFQQFQDLVSTLEPSPVGKQLDFLLQEMNREVNTIGSKAGDLGITDTVILFKTELEKIREQVQNVE